ncbi:DNA (cytosine-5-)-methyltransferase [Massilia sp. UMI-21]|nr:DNA (cytosine-5-)-methyltransferase [Massilia sp. UMI-21]
MDAVSLFSGCGGSDLGLHTNGFSMLMANDILPKAAETYRHNLPDTDFRLGDVSLIKNFPKAQLLVGCYPCQGFSQGGARQTDRSINFLYREFDRALRQIKPKAFIVENVSGMTHSNYSHLLNNQIRRFRSAGYLVNYSVLNAANYGVAQERRRIFIVGIRSDFGIRYEFPAPTHGPNALNPYVSQADAIGHLPAWPVGKFWEENFHWYYMSRDRRREWNLPSKTIVSNARHMPLYPGSPVLEKVQEDEWRFSSNEPARRLSFEEAQLLQGFPQTFSFPETVGLRDRYKVIGNAVPPPLFAAVSGALPPIWD